MRLIVLVNFLFVYTLSLAQKQHAMSLGSSLYAGHIIPHSKDIAALASANPIGYSLFLAWQSNREKATEASPIRAKKGFRFAYTYFDNPAQLGNGYQVTAFTEPMIRSRKKLFFSFPLDAGIAYLSKIYHPILNPENLFFGSNISFYLGVGAQLNYKLGNRFIGQLGANYQHISNGGIKMPNKGMNFPSYSLGFTYYLNQANWDDLAPISGDLKPLSNSLRLFAFGSFKTVPNPNTLVPMGGVQLLYSKSINTWHNLIIGSELVFNTYKKEWYSKQNLKVNPWEQSLQAGYELRIGNTSLMFLLGAELLNEKRLNSILYQRYALMQKLGKNIYVAGTLKANAHVADIFDLRIGYQFIR